MTNFEKFSPDSNLHSLPPLSIGNPVPYQFPDRFVDGPCLLGGSECGGSGLLPAFPSLGHPLLATVGDLKAFSYILRTVPLWCRQVVSASMYSF